MATLFIWLLTAILLLDCLFLVLLVLVQLPKKEAGAGLAFGGAATDALFGAGSGTALTKITKYAATIFFVVTLTLAVLQSRVRPGAGASEIDEKLKASATTSSQATVPSPITTPAPQTPPAAAPAPVAPAAPTAPKDQPK